MKWYFVIYTDPDFPLTLENIHRSAKTYKSAADFQKMSGMAGATVILLVPGTKADAR